MANYFYVDVDQQKVTKLIAKCTKFDIKYFVDDLMLGQYRILILKNRKSFEELE